MTTDEELLADAAPGRAGPSFAAFYERHERALLAYFRRRVATPEVAADLAAETFAQALASRRRFKGRGDGSGAAWLYGIAAHVLARSVRRGRVEVRARHRLGLPPCALDDAALTAIDQLAGDATAALEALPPDQREAVWARVVGEREYPEIAAELQCSEAAARQRVSRGLAALRRELRGTR